jgi:hypothetical protein
VGNPHACIRELPTWSPGAVEAAPLDCFQRCAAVLMEFGHRHAILERMHLVVQREGGKAIVGNVS